jgi:hypothetical protein
MPEPVMGSDHTLNRSAVGDLRTGLGVTKDVVQDGEQRACHFERTDVARLMHGDQDPVGKPAALFDRFDQQ